MDRQKWTDRNGQTEMDRQKWTDRNGQTEMDHTYIHTMMVPPSSHEYVVTPVWF